MRSDAAAGRDRPQSGGRDPSFLAQGVWVGLDGRRLIGYQGLMRCTLPSQGHNQLNEQQHCYQQTSGDTETGGAS